MDEHDWLATRFEEQRPHLRAVAYRMLGSLSEADDAVQDAWLRLSRSDASAIENLGGWLTTVVARVCLNLLRSRDTRREEALGLQMPDPIISREGENDPEREALLTDAVGLALLVVLDALEPAERLAFVLHDMFAVPFDEIAQILERSPVAACGLPHRSPPPIAHASASLSMHFSPPHAMAISTPSSPSSTPTYCCARTVGELTQAHPSSSRVPEPSQGGRSCSHRRHHSSDRLS